MEPSPPDIFHVTRDESYLRLLREEEAFWNPRSETVLSRTPPPEVQRYFNERLTGDSNRQWFEVISDYGQFRQGCVLGAGPGNVESHLLSRHKELRLTVYDISGEALTRLRKRLEPDFAGRFETRREDLNFVTLPAESCDLLVVDTTIHHLVNLEHVAFQVNQCLTPEGFFFMRDTVCESRFQFSEEKKRIFQALVDATQDPLEPAPSIPWPDTDNWTYSPFESVRSGEILEIFGRYLQEISLRPVSALVSLTVLFGGASTSQARVDRLRRRLLRAGAAVWARLLGTKTDVAQRRAKMELLFAVDRVVSDAGLLKPGMALAVYRKRRRGGSSV